MYWGDSISFFFIHGSSSSKSEKLSLLHLVPRAVMSFTFKTFFYPSHHLQRFLHDFQKSTGSLTKYNPLKNQKKKKTRAIGRAPV